MKQAKDWGGLELRELNELAYEELVLKQLKKRRKTENDLLQDLKSADWKIAIARLIRKQTSATNPWIAARLNMGDPSNVSRHINRIPNIKG